jgi:hypothetical protein
VGLDLGLELSLVEQIAPVRITNDMDAPTAYTAIVEKVSESHPGVPIRSLDWFDEIRFNGPTDP